MIYAMGGDWLWCMIHIYPEADMFVLHAFKASSFTLHLKLTQNGYAHKKLGRAQLHFSYNKRNVKLYISLVNNILLL